MHVWLVVSYLMVMATRMMYMAGMLSAGDGASFLLTLRRRQPWRRRAGSTVKALAKNIGWSAIVEPDVSIVTVISPIVGLPETFPLNGIFAA